MYLTHKKVAVLGAAGAIGSNMVQDLLATGTACNISMYDPFESGLRGAAEEIAHCAFEGANVTCTTEIGEALTGANYILSSGGAPRKDGMTREDLLRGNCEIARDLGLNIRRYAPDTEFVIIIFNPADITGLTTLVHSGLEAGRVSTLAALDSTRLQARLAQHFGVIQDEVRGCATYGGHGEKMAVFAGALKVAGIPFSHILGGGQANGIGLTGDEWGAIQNDVRQGGANIIRLRGRSSFQSPAHQTVAMLRGRINDGGYKWPCGVYFKSGPYANVMMAADAEFAPHGLVGHVPAGTPDDMAALDDSYVHLCKLRDEMITAGLLPPVKEWHAANPHL